MYLSSDSTFCFCYNILVSDHDWLINKCVSALELCRKRFPGHYKSTYHLARFYFKNKKYKDNEKVKDLLLGPKGLFGQRNRNNFFNVRISTIRGYKFGSVYIINCTTS